MSIGKCGLAETHQSCVAFLDLLSIRGVIDGVIDIPSEVEDGLRVRGLAMAFSINMTIQCLGSGGNLGTEGCVRAIHSSNIRRHGKRAINLGIF
jgi:hypothetical protein